MHPDHIRTTLLARQREILDRLQRLNKHVGHRETPLSADFSEQAIELENLDVLFELDSTSRHELNQINTALRRLDEGQYETCVRCGAAIGTARLQATPYTGTCIDCARA